MRAFRMLVGLLKVNLQFQFQPTEKERLVQLEINLVNLQGEKQVEEEFLELCKFLCSLLRRSVCDTKPHTYHFELGVQLV